MQKILVIFRQLGVNQANSSKSMERLSSGMRINRAGDDAAGLAISEKMRGQIRGLKQAQRNAQDGISLIQTAEGALNEIHAILQRMRELATQSATDTNTPEDRLEIQKEIDQLATEITRISTDTEFNTQNLLGGQFKAKFHIGANQGQNVELEINAMDADALGVSGTESAKLGVVADKAIAAATGTGGKNFADGTYTVMAKADYKGAALTDNDVEETWEGVEYVLVDSNNQIVGTSDGSGVFTGVGAESGNAAITDFGVSAKEITQVTVTDNGTKATATIGITGDNNKLETGTYEVVDLKHHATYGGDNSVFGLKDASGNIVALGYDETKQAENLAEVVRWVDVNDTTKSLLSHTADIKIDGGLKVGSKITVTGSGIDVSSQTSADKAIKIINDALETVSAERSKLGAMQNRLEHTIANLGTSAENLQAAESRIRDLDMAEEIMAFTK
ncbi:MAG: hypothetical protein AA931_08975, partial [Peptococcaceae bacterium 1109]